MSCAKCGEPTAAKWTASFWNAPEMHFMFGLNSAKSMRPSIAVRGAASICECVRLGVGTRCLPPAITTFLVSVILSLLATFNTRADDIRTAGDILQFVLPATAAGLTLGFRDYKGTLQFGESFAVTEAATYSLKYAVNEQRPNGGSGSFPSAHTSVSFSAAEFMRKRYGWAFGVPAYAAATFVGYSRVEAREHWPHDVIAGAGIGILSSYIFTRPYKGWNVQVEGDSRYVGLRLSRNW
jgi:membrane-associated phospholipid phosphatase